MTSEIFPNVTTSEIKLGQSRETNFATVWVGTNINYLLPNICGKKKEQNTKIWSKRNHITRTSQYLSHCPGDWSDDQCVFWLEIKPDEVASVQPEFMDYGLRVETFWVTVGLPLSRPPLPSSQIKCNFGVQQLPRSICPLTYCAETIEFTQYL